MFPKNSRNELNRLAQEYAASCNGHKPKVSERAWQLVYEFSRCVAALLARKLPPQVQFEDLVMAGVEHTLWMFEHFDPGKGADFTSYAQRRLLGAMLDFLRAEDWIPRSVRNKLKQLEARAEVGEGSLEQLISEQIRTDHIQVYTQGSLLRIEDLGQLGSGDADLGTALAKLGALTEPSQERDEWRQSRELVIRACLDRLPANERLILELHYWDDYNLLEIGDILDLTESRVSQLREQAIRRLQALLMLEGHTWETLTIPP